MFRKFAVTLSVLFLLPVLVLAQDGKLRGKVSDKESGEPLIGANVTIDGTTLGASTDVNGEYIILSVPPGAYTVKASYIGYSPVTVSNIRVNSNLTTTGDFALSSTAVQVSAVEIFAERPLIQRNTTNTVRLNTQENIRNIPFRGIQNILALEAGVVSQRGVIYVRGGRAGDVAYFVDGANTTNPFYNSQNVTVLQEALEELQLQSGGWTAEHGGANAGLVRQTVRTGGHEIKGSVSYQTDDFAKPGSTFLGTTARGFKNAIATLGGPLGSDNIRFFLAGQMNYERNRSRMFLEPFRFDSLKTDNLGARPAGVLLPGPVEYKKNSLSNNWTQANSVVGTLLFDANPFKMRFTGSYSFDQNPIDNTWGNLGGYFNQKRSRMDETQTIFGNLRVTHILNPTTFYEVGASYQSRYFRRIDPDFGDTWLSYPDSIANANIGYTGWRSRFSGPAPYSTIYRFNFTDPNAPNNSYTKNKQTSLGLTLDFTSQMNSKWEVKVGGRLESWSIRNFTVNNIQSYLTYLYGVDGKSVTTFADDYTRRVELIRNGDINNYGYDIDGNESDGFGYGGSTLDKPAKPLFASAYIQNKFEYNDLILNVGVRYEYMDVKGLKLPSSSLNNPGLDTAHGLLNTIDETALVATDPIGYLLPRISFSFPVTDRTVFYALYGNYAQSPSLNNLYMNSERLDARLNPSRRQPYWLGGTLPGFLMKPERTTQYEAGFRQSLSDNFALTVSGFYKDLKDQLSIRRVFNDLGNPMFVGLQNEDFGTVKGLELTLELRRTNRLAAKVNYTLSDARGTGSTPLSSANGVTDEASARFPLFILPFTYNQTHRGSVLLDYRFDKGDGGPLLEGFGVNALLTFNSGHAYTKIKEPQNLGQANPWNIGVRAMLDSRSRNPVEPINSSTTPWVFNIDMNINKVFFLGGFNLELYVNVLNLLNTRQVFNVYPTTGTPFDDGWLKSPFAEAYKSIPNYTAFYKAINIDNRWGIFQANEDPFGGTASGGTNTIGYGDLFGPPREVRVGVKVEF